MVTASPVQSGEFLNCPESQKHHCSVLKKKVAVAVLVSLPAAHPLPLPFYTRTDKQVHACLGFLLCFS